MTRQRGAPRASAASRSDPGTTRMTSSAVRIMMGSMTMASAMLAAKPDVPF